MCSREGSGQLAFHFEQENVQTRFYEPVVSATASLVATKSLPSAILKRFPLVGEGALSL